MTGGGKGAPAPPDYTGAAEAQAQGSRQNVIEQTYANRPNIVTPYGNVTWTRPDYPGTPGYMADEAGTGMGSQNAPAGLGGAVAGALGQGGGGGSEMDPYGGYDPSAWQMNVNLPPEAQAALEAQQRINLQRSQMGEQMAGTAMQDLQQGVDWGGLPEVTGGEAARNAAEQALYQRGASRLDPMWQQRQQQQTSQLAAQGLEPGTEAYTRAMGDLNRAQTDAYQALLNESIMGGGQEASRQYQLDAANRARAIQEAYQQQYGGINALNAALQGQQVQMPQFPGFAQAGQAQAPQYLQAAQLGYQGALNQYGANQAGMQGLFGGLTGLAGLPFAF